MKRAQNIQTEISKYKAVRILAYISQYECKTEKG